MAERISTKVSLDGTKELYLIIVGIGITEALMHTADFTRLSEFAPYMVLLMGYLFTVLRFSLGMINMLGHVAERVHHHWGKVVSFVALSFLACGLCFFWMGLHLQNMPVFIAVTMLLLLADWSTLFISHRPWSPPRGWGWWMLWKSLAIFFWYPGGHYDPRRDTVRYPSITEESRLVKSTHYQWIRSNFWLFCLLVVSLGLWIRLKNLHVPPRLLVTPNEYKTILFELWLGLLLLAFSFWDFKVNKVYYFGEDEAKPEGQGL